MMFQIPLPPPNFDYSPGPIFQFLVCILLPLMWFGLFVQLLPERWREKVCELQFGPRWTKEHSRRD